MRTAGYKALMHSACVSGDSQINIFVHTQGVTMGFGFLSVMVLKGLKTSSNCQFYTSLYFIYTKQLSLQAKGYNLSVT